MSDFNLLLTEDKKDLLIELQQGHLLSAYDHLEAYIQMASLYSGLAVPVESDNILVDLEQLVDKVQGE